MDSILFEALIILNLSLSDLAIFKYPSLTLLKKTDPLDSIRSLLSLIFLEKPSSTEISNKKLRFGLGQLIKFIGGIHR